MVVGNLVPENHALPPFKINHFPAIVSPECHVDVEGEKRWADRWFAEVEFFRLPVRLDDNCGKLQDLPCRHVGP